MSIDYIREEDIEIDDDTRHNATARLEMTKSPFNTCAELR